MKILGIILIVLLAMFAGITACSAIFIAILNSHNPMLTHDSAETFLQDNKEQLFIVRDFLESGEFKVSIRRTDVDNEEMFAGLIDGERIFIPIEDEIVLETIRQLFQNGCHAIGSRENKIFFSLWSTRNHGRGIVYSIDGRTPDESDFSFLTRIEPLSEEGWFFYVEDYNVWRRRNNTSH